LKGSRSPPARQPSGVSPKGGTAPKLLELGTSAVEKKKEEVAKEAGVEVKKP
jgi:hypothetical protein